MKDVLDRLLANDLRDLAGSRLQASIAITDRLANEVAGTLLDRLAAGRGAPGAPTPAGPGLDPTTLLGHLRRLDVAFHEGRAVVDVEAAIDDPAGDARPV